MSDGLQANVKKPKTGLGTPETWARIPKAAASTATPTGTEADVNSADCPSAHHSFIPSASQVVQQRTRDALKISLKTPWTHCNNAPTNWLCLARRYDVRKLASSIPKYFEFNAAYPTDFTKSDCFLESFCGDVHQTPGCNIIRKPQEHFVHTETQHACTVVRCILLENVVSQITDASSAVWQSIEKASAAMRRTKRRRKNAHFYI